MAHVPIFHPSLVTGPGGTVFSKSRPSSVGMAGEEHVGKGSAGLLSALNPSSLGHSKKMSDSSFNLENTLEVLFVFYTFYSPVGFWVIVGSC